MRRLIQRGNDDLASALRQTSRELTLRRNSTRQSGQLLRCLVSIRNGHDVGNGRAMGGPEQ